MPVDASEPPTIERARTTKLAALLYKRLAGTSEPLFGKWNAYYVHAPRGQQFACSKCVWYLPDQQACRLVNAADPPDEGVILPTATCNLWNAGPLRVRLNTRLRGRGANADHIAPGNLRYQLERVAVKEPHTTPPPDVVNRIIFPKGLTAGVRGRYYGPTPSTRAAQPTIVESEPSQQQTPAGRDEIAEKGTDAFYDDGGKY